jgi:hypothetical protein
MLKEVGGSGPILLAKRFASQLLEVLAKKWLRNSEQRARPFLAGSMVYEIPI